MKNYYVLIPDADEFKIIQSLIRKRVLEKRDITVVTNLDQINEGNIRNEISVQIPLEDSKYRVHFIQSGVGKVATCRTMKMLLRIFDQHGIPDHVIMAGSACGKVPGIYNVFNSYQEIDLRPAGRGMGESPDLPICYTSEDVGMFADLKTCDSLTVERFCSEFPDTSVYDGIASNVVVDMEDYAFAAMLYDEGVDFSIVRGVTDEGDFESWKDSLESCIEEIYNILISTFEN